MSSSRPFLLALLAVATTVAFGDSILTAQTSSAPTVNVRRVTSLNYAVWPGDFNGDGIVDVVSHDPYDSGLGQILIELGKGDGTFNAPRRTGIHGTALATGDFDKDGKLDVLVAPSDQSRYGPLAVMTGRGDGTLAAPRRIGSATTLSIAFGLAADVDGDGNLDAIVGIAGEADDDAVLIYPGHGDGTFADAAALYMTGNASAPLGATVADLNGDGRRDLAVANHDGHFVSVFLNQGAFNFLASDIRLDRQANDVVAADVNRDGKMDLLVATSADGSDDLFYIDGYVYVLLGKGDGTFAAPVQYQTAPGAWRIVVADFTRDGIPDVATANRSAKIDVDTCGFLWDSVSILPGRTDGTFAAASSFSLGNQSNLADFRYRDSVFSLATADVNRDGQPDLLASFGAIVLNQPADPNWAPSVNAGPDRVANADGSVTLQAIANDSDQDFLTYAWTDSGGEPIEPSPSPCPFTPKTKGIHTITVTVNDGHGHTASDSVVVDFGGGSSTPGTVTVTAPAAGETVQVARSYTVRWTASGDLAAVTRWIVQVTTDGSHWSNISECSNLPPSARQCSWSNPSPITSSAQIVVTNGSDVAEVSGTSGVFSIGGPSGGSLGNGWTHADVGHVAAAGTASHGGFQYDGEVLNVSASGADIWGTADEFHYVWKLMTGDFQINVRVDSLQNVNAWTKAGIMVRVDPTNPASSHSSIFVTPGHGVVFQRRVGEFATSLNTAGPAAVAPVWLRMVRMGNTLKAYYRKNPTDAWTFVGQQAYTGLADPIAVGVAVTSHQDGTLAAAKFNGVKLTSLPSLFANAIGGGTGSATTDGTTYTVKASGTDIWGTRDSFLFLGAAIGANEQITARVRSIGNTYSWAKAGVMIRETLDPGSKHADAVVTPSKGIALQYRSAASGASAMADNPAGAAPMLLRIRRFEGASPSSPGDILAWWSNDGALTWHPFCCEAPVSTTHDAYIGLAVTSHAPGVETTVVIDDVWIEQ